MRDLRLSARQRELGENLNQRDVRLGELRTEISEREEQLPALPALREEAVATDTQIAELERAAEAIAIARETLEQRGASSLPTSPH